jgi:uncharacterized membrane protein
MKKYSSNIVPLGVCYLVMATYPTIGWYVILFASLFVIVSSVFLSPLFTLYSKLRKQYEIVRISREALDEKQKAMLGVYGFALIVLGYLFIYNLFAFLIRENT